MKKIRVFIGDGTDELCEVVDNLGFNHDVGAYTKEVRLPDGALAMAVGRGKAWRLWSVHDRIKPLVDAAKKGWPTRKDIS